MSEVKVIQNNELTPEEIKDEEDVTKLLQEIMGSTKQSTGIPELAFFTEPMVFTEEECLEMMKSEQFKKGLEYALQFAGMYSGLVGFGVDMHTANEFILMEHTKNVNIETQKIINDGVKLQSATNKLRS